MRLLLDTHAWLWHYLGDPKLSSVARAAIDDPANEKLISPASYWEIAIKVALGKYRLAESYDDFIQHSIFDNGFGILHVEPRHASVLVTLPRHHNDPFDRLLIAQSVCDNISVVSRDPDFVPYPIRLVW